MNKTTRFLLVVLMVFCVALPMFAGGQRDSAAGLTVVRYLNQETNPQVVAIQRDWITGFRQEYPQFDVALEGAPAAVINQTIATYTQAGAPLDVIHADGGSAARLAAAGRLAPLDDIVEKLGGRDAFFPGRLLIYNDRVYSINQAPTSPTLHYRTDIFEKHGLSTPRTYQDVLNAARIIDANEPGMSGLGLPGGENRATTIYSGIFMWGFGGNYYDADLNVTTNTREVRQALEFYAQLLQYAPEDASGWAFNEPAEAYMAGRTAMLFLWNGADLIRRQNPALLEVTNIVRFPAGPRMHVTEQGGRYISIWGASRNLEASKAWVEYIFRPENSIKLTEMEPGMYPPKTHADWALAERSTADAFRLYGDALFNEVFKSAEIAYNQIFHAGGIAPSYDRPRETGILNPLIDAVWGSNVYATAVQRVAYGGWSVDRAVVAMTEELERLSAALRAELGL